MDRPTSRNVVKAAAFDLILPLSVVSVASFFIGLSALATLLYMEGVYDRVFSSRNLSTLGFLTFFALIVWVVTSTLETLRSHLLSRLALRLERRLREPVFRAAQVKYLRHPPTGKSHSVARTFFDLDTIRDFVAGPAVPAMIDGIWTPIFLFVGFVVHPLIGATLTICVIIVMCLGLVSKMISTPAMVNSVAANVAASDFATATIRNSETLHALGMTSVMTRAWVKAKEKASLFAHAHYQKAGFVQFLISLMKSSASTINFAVAAVLVVDQQISPANAMIVYLLTNRTLAPISAMISGTRSFIVAQGAYGRLVQLTSEIAQLEPRLELPAPLGNVSFVDAQVVIPGNRKAAVTGASFSVPAGMIVGVVGPSGGGKSTLLKAICGILPLRSGTLRIDGVELEHWNEMQRGKMFGYLPQDVELFSGTVADNICRFDGRHDPAAIVAAAKMAGVHDMIVSLSNGYDTVISENGRGLSGGQRQRVGLARSLYGKPPIILLDEPNSNLDSDGEKALFECIQRLKENRTTVFIVTHKSSILSAVDRMLLIADGSVIDYGTTDVVLKRISRPKVVSLANGAKATDEHGH